MKITIRFETDDHEPEPGVVYTFPNVPTREFSVKPHYKDSDVDTGIDVLAAVDVTLNFRAKPDSQETITTYAWEYL
jgi:hypothetical protein